jgi:putative N6-adenine-specific DNA methylase
VTRPNRRPRRTATSRPAPAGHALFAVAAPGLEPLVAQELARLGLRGETTPGGVAFHGEGRDLYRANLHLRTASRVLLRLGEFYAAAFSELRAKASRLPWATALQPGQPVAIKATCHKSKLYHSDAVAERVAGAIEDRLGHAVVRVRGRAEGDDEAGDDHPAEGSAPALVIVRLVRDIVTISLDTSGALLHQRGYRQATAKAPLRETLAAAMLLASGWDPAAPLLDPFCGAGTIPIEAALLALNLPPGRARHFAFMDWPDFQPDLWQAILREADAARRTMVPPIWGSDRDAGAIEAARLNAERAGVAEHIRFTRQAVSALEAPPGTGWVVTNPPYGVRVKESGDLRNLYAQLGKTLRARCAGWHVALLAADARLAHSTGLPFDDRRKLPLVNGGLRVSLMQSQLPPPSPGP